MVQKIPADIETGVYIGWAKVDSGEVHKAVLSIGWCPFYGNNEKSVVSSIEFRNFYLGISCDVRPSRFARLVIVAIYAIQIDWMIKQFFHSEQETHILHSFDGDLYGKILKLCICGYLRPEANFDSLDSLIAAIQKDIKDAKDYLDTEPFFGYRDHEIFNHGATK